MLILTQNKKKFQDLLKKYDLDPSRYYVQTVPHEEVLRYLAACDSGILFREPHIINWVSRPTKVLEYQAAGLEIVHNNTVEMLTTANRPS